MGEFWTTGNDDVQNIYHDVLIALEEKLHINNGQPSLYAHLFDKLAIAPGESVLHRGCGRGYYTALMAAIIGPGGTIAAFEIQPLLAERAQVALTS
jgi:protein-L-isoaspartate(D-aspartate) O-methyltransferase